MFGLVCIMVRWTVICNNGLSLVENVPIIREMVNCGLLIANVLLASSVTLTAIAIGWLRHRPLIAMALFSSAAIPYMVIKQRRKSNLA